MGLKTDQITNKKSLQELLSQLGDKSDVIEVAEVDGDKDGYLDVNDVTKKWSPHQFASVENALFRSGLIRSFSSSKQAPVYRLSFQDQANPAPKIEENLKAIYISVIHDGKPQGILLTPDILARHPSLEIDGYVGNIIVFGKESMRVNLNHQDFYKVSQQNRDSLSVTLDGITYNVYPKDITAPGIEPDFILNLFNNVDKLTLILITKISSFLLS